MTLNKPPLSTAQLTRTAVLSAVMVLLLFAVRWSPTADLAFYTLMSLGMMIIRWECGLLSAALSWLAVSLLGLAVVGLPTVWPFAFFFGVWPMLKAALERRFPMQDRRARGWGLLCKGVAFAVWLVLTYWIFQPFLALGLSVWQEQLHLPKALLALILWVLAWVYDTVLTVLLSEYVVRLRPYLNRRRR